MQTRYYDPEVGRFINIDAIEYINDDPMHGLNLYAYCANNPVMYVDPTGNSLLLFCFIFGIFAGAATLGTIKGIQAAQSGASGWELFGQVLQGIFEGALLGGILGIGLGLMGSGIAAFGTAIGGGGLALASGGVLGVGATAAVGAGTVVLGGIVVVEAWRYGANVLFAKKNDPYSRPDQKKMYREFKNKARQSDNWVSKSGRRRNKPPKKHTPGRGHKHYLLWLLLWPFFDDSED